LAPPRRGDRLGRPTSTTRSPRACRKAASPAPYLYDKADTLYDKADTLAEKAGRLAELAREAYDALRRPRTAAVGAAVAWQGRHYRAGRLLDLLTAAEDTTERAGGRRRLDVQLLAGRLAAALDWLATERGTAGLAVGLFGASTGAGAALLVAADRPAAVAAVVSRAGRRLVPGAPGRGARLRAGHLLGQPITGPTRASHAMREDGACCARQHLRASKWQPTAVRRGVFAARLRPSGAK
jgi:hypothetical protein